MPVIKSKKKPVIKKGAGMIYDPATFMEKHKQANFFVMTDPEEMMRRIDPYEYAEGKRIITFDTETHPYFSSSHIVPRNVVRRWVGKGKQAVPQDFPFCISICDGKNCYTIFDDEENEFKKFRALAPLFENPLIEKCAHNAKYDMHMIANVGMKIVGRLHDTVVLAKIVNENRRSYELAQLASLLPQGIVKYEYMVDNYKQMHKITTYTQIPRELLSEYANADVWNCFWVFLDNYNKLAAENLTELYDTECELMVVLYAAERYGMRIDAAYEDPLKKALQEQAILAEEAIYAEAGKLFNINSAKQLYGVLMDLGVDSSLIGRTDKGNPSLDKDALNYLAEVHNVSIVKKILEFRKVDKLLNTYAVGIYGQRDAEYRVHSSINQTEATTGRMSITKPALQTLPKKDKSIRSAFIPEDGYTLVFMDLDQVEYRIYAHYAKIPWLLKAIREGYDVHAATAALIFNKDLDALVKAVHEGDEDATYLRSKAKTINFALLYGVGIDHLAEMLGCSKTEAAEIKSRYFSSMPEARVFVNTVNYRIKTAGYVRNLYGRRRRLDPDDSYKALNALVQGCAADYIKDKMVRLYKYLRYNNLKTHIANVVHDEDVFQAHKDEMEHLPKLRWIMSEFEKYRCPITAGVEVGEHDWGHKTEIDVGFEKPESDEYLSYNVYDGSVFDINREVA